MEHKWLKNFDSQGNWTKPERKLHIDGVWYDLDEYAKEKGIQLPDSKPVSIKADTVKKHKTKVNSNEDIRQQDDSGVDPEFGNGISEDTE